MIFPCVKVRTVPGEPSHFIAEETLPHVPNGEAVLVDENGRRIPVAGLPGFVAVHESLIVAGMEARTVDG